MRLTCYATTSELPNIVPARVERVWMDQTINAQAYRCLPLNIANSHGWMILNTVPFVAEWDGGNATSAITIRTRNPNEAILAESHFGSGVLTFHVKGVFRTEPSYDLLVTGPFNRPKDAIQPLSGIVETDWSPFTFTMNWKFTRPGTQVMFDQDEPFCMIYPMQRGLVDDVEPEIRPIASNPKSTLPSPPGPCDAAASINLSVRRTLKHWPGNGRRITSPEKRRSPKARRIIVPKLRPKPFTVVTNWKPGGLMDQLCHEQTDDNWSGRQRLRDGVLIPTPSTVRLTPDEAIDSDALDFICHPHFLTPAEIALLAEAARGLTASPAADNQSGNGAVTFADIIRERADAARLMSDIQGRITRRLMGFYELTLPLVTDSLHLLRLGAGSWVAPRATRAHADGAPHDMAHRDFASIIILNDDYAGGELYFPRLDFVVKPSAGMLLAFTAGWHHEQGVTQVSTGAQLTMAAFHTFDAAMRDPGLMAMDAPVG